MDLITALPPTLTGFDAIAVFVDKLSKMTHIAPCKTSINATEFAQLYIDTVVKHHGMTTKMVSDRDARFTGHFLRELTTLMGTKQALSTAFHPQTDGQTERMNRVVEDMIRHYVGPYHDDWDRSLSLVEFAINNAWQESIQTTPFLAHQGYDPRTPLTGGVARKCPAAQAFWDKHTERRDYCIKFMQAAQERQKAYANRSQRDVKFATGDAVMLSTTNVKFKATGKAKFMPRFMGPFIVTEVYGPQDRDGNVVQVTACKVKLPDLMKIHPVFHVSVLKHFKSDGEPVPIQPLAYDKDGSPLWEVDRIINERVVKVHKKRHVEYMVQGTGFAAEHDTWKSTEYIKEAAPHVVDVWQGYALRHCRIEAGKNRNTRRNST